MKTNINLKLKPAYLFVILLLGVAFYYNYWDIIHRRPQSIHRWRQSDCAAIAINYYQHGMRFFHPEVLYQISDGGTSGYTVGEFPGLYYLVALLWKLFGYHDSIYRLTNTLIFFLGLFALFRLLQRLLKDNFWSIALSLLLFTSPVVIYYASNYITDTSALSLTLIGWSLFFKYSLQNNKYAFYLAMLFFTLAGLLKVVALMSVIAILGVFILETVGLKKMSIFKDNFKLDLKKASVFFLLFLLVASWYSYAIYYNKLHKAYTSNGIPYFSTQIFPIWNLDKQHIVGILKDVKDGWLKEYYSYTAILFFLISTLFMFIWIKKQDQFLSIISLFFLVGVLSVSMLWFYAFAQHDYYIINLLIFPLFAVITLFEYLKREQKVIFNSGLSKIVFTIFILFNIHYAKGKLTDRYEGWVNDYPIYKDVHTITPYLRKIGIKPTDKVICLPDPTTCYTLYLMNQPGWTGANFLNDTVQIKKYIALGATYLILTEPEPFSRPCLQLFMKNKIGEYGSVSIFTL